MRPVLAALLVCFGPAFGADPDAAALKLADETVTAGERAGDWRIYTEAALRDSTQRPTALRAGGAHQSAGRLSLDVRMDKTLTPELRAVFADRVDINWQSGAAAQNSINTLKEAYLSWQPQADRIADLGRINPRYGVATGYNPTDYFRAGALRTLTSIDPASLRENRMGSAMLRGQALWAGGSLIGLYSPKLSDQPTSAPFSPNFGATNARNRWLVSASHAISETLSPQVILSGGEGQSTQVGLNLSALASDALVFNFEASAGRSRSLASQALARPDDSAFRSRVAAGGTYTTAGKLSITAEIARNGAGMDSEDWDALRRGSPVAYGRYRAFVGNLLEIPTRSTLFLYATLTDAGINRLDLAAMLRHDLVDGSRLYWTEARYRWTDVDFALQLQVNRGAALSNFGALADAKTLQALVRKYF